MRREAGFTIIEVLIAVLILAVVASGVAFATAGGAKLRGVAKLQASLTSAGVRAQEDLVTDRSWMERTDCRKVNDTCDVRVNVRPDSLKLDGVGSAAILSSATSTAVDGKVDGVGSADKDGVTPDYFRIDLVLGVDAKLAARYGTTPTKLTHEMSISVDRRGVEQVGSLAVEVCRVTNQSDERMTLQGCAPTGAAGIRIAGCPPAPRPGCNQAFDWIAALGQSETAPSPFVMLRRASAPFTLRNSAGKTWSSASAVTADGLVVFQNVPAGDYNLVGLPESIGAGSERWDSKEVPAFHGAPGRAASGYSVVVEPGVRNRALVLFRPSRNSTGGIRVYADREIHDYRLSGELSSSEMVVPEWTPTTSYLGGSAEQACAYAGSEEAKSWGGETTCDGIEAGPGPNCTTVYMSGAEYEHTGTGTDDWSGFSGGNGAGMLSTPGAGDFKKVMFKHRRAAQYCTVYSELHTYAFHRGSGPGAGYILPGAVVGGVDYQVAPMPDNRVVDVSPAGMAQLPHANCNIVAARTQCGSIGPLQPGLNSGVVARQLGGGGNPALNENIIAMPGWIKGAGLWVGAGGNIVSPAGSVGTNPTVHIRGKGECYWTGPRWSGKVEGPCSPCSPIWTPPSAIVGACSILVRDDVLRIVKEHMDVWDLATGAYRGDYMGTIAKDTYTIPFSPAWRCSSATPSLKAGTCSRQPTGGGGAVRNPGGKYLSKFTGGTAIVESAPISEPTA